jgi:hypothetical protein
MFQCSVMGRRMCKEPICRPLSTWSKRGKRYIGENIHAASQTNRPRENKAIQLDEVAAGNAVLRAVEKRYRENVRYNYNTEKMIRFMGNLFNRFCYIAHNELPTYVLHRSLLPTVVEGQSAPRRRRGHHIFTCLILSLNI